MGIMIEMDTRIILAASWIALMLTYLLGDVLRIFAGEYVAGQISGQAATQGMWMLAAVIMLVPILMLLLALMLPYPLNRWVNIVAAVGLFIFNLIALPGYPGMYDKFLIVVGLGINVLTVIYAWNWMVPAPQ
jgi:hypothetical protein